MPEAPDFSNSAAAAPPLAYFEADPRTVLSAASPWNRTPLSLISSAEDKCNRPTKQEM
jgi:hypothetical protein